MAYSLACRAAPGAPGGRLPAAVLVQQQLAALLDDQLAGLQNPVARFAAPELVAQKTARRHPVGAQAVQRPAAQRNRLPRLAAPPAIAHVVASHITLCAIDLDLHGK